jgi:Fe-S cluster biogenesis protein NfuA
MPSTVANKDFQDRLQRLDSLLLEAERHADPAAQARHRKMVQALLDLHGSGLERLLELMAEAGETGREILDACAGDSIVSGLLLLHGLHPLGVQARVEKALESVRPYLRSHGGNVELLEVRESLVRLRLEGSCHHCPSSSQTMQQTVEEAIYGNAPEITEIEVEGLPEDAPSEEGDGSRLALTVL